MILLPQSVLHDCCAVFRRTLPKSNMARAAVNVQISGGRDGIRLRLVQPEVAVEYHHATVSEAFSFAVAITALTDCMGRGNGTVEFKLSKNDKVEIHWEQSGVPHCREHPLREFPASYPDWPNRDVANDPTLVGALSSAMQIPTGGAGRLSLTHVQLRGKQGDVVATDGRQLLINGGFQFPWKDSLHVPRTSVFASRELGSGQVVRVAQSKSHVHFRIGGWTIALPIETCARFPNVDTVIPKANLATTTWHIAEIEALPLAALLDDLPAADEEMSPITIDLGKLPAIRARAEKETRCTEVGLPRSRVDGKATRIVMNRVFLQRALELGFRSFVVTAPDKPILCLDGKRLYVCITHDPNSALPAQRNAMRIMLPATSTNEGATPTAPKQGRHSPVSVPIAVVPSRSPGRSLNGLVQCARSLWDLVRKQRRDQRVG